jgi:hypothetical protein
VTDRAARDAAVVDPRLDARAVTFENPTGARGAGGSAHGGRKGAPNRRVRAGERVVLADIDGPGIVRHLWMTVPPAPPERLRGLLLEVFYDDATEPSISVPVIDFFGLPHGRLAPYESAYTTVLEGRGLTSYLPMPFAKKLRVEFVNASTAGTILYFQIDYTLVPELAPDHGHLHVTFRRENPTTLRRDFVIAAGLRGPGRFLGCNVGVRVIAILDTVPGPGRFLGCVVGIRTIDDGTWYGEGEVKVYRDGDEEYPTICGTGLEDYVGSAWGLGRCHATYSGAPLVVHPGTGSGGPLAGNPDFVGFYRWHLPDPIMFASDLRVTIQQIGAKFFAAGQEAALEAYEATNPVAGEGWHRGLAPGMLAWGIAERVDDYCATAYVYCTEVQAVPRVDVAVATADLDRRDYEVADPFELFGGMAAGAG